MTREEAIAILDGFKYNPLLNEQHFEALDMAVTALSADVREDIHGTWELWKGNTYAGIHICSNCKHGFPFITTEYNFCPNCGADMRGN